MANEQVSNLKFSEAIGRIESGKIAPIYFLTGDEDFLQIEFVNALKNALFGKKPQDTNIERISARAGKAHELVNTALEYSLFGGGKLVIVYDLQKYNDSDRNMLLDFFPQLPPDNHIVLIYHGKMDMRKKFFKYLTSKVEWLSLLPLTQQNAKFWAQRQLKKYDLKIEDSALDFLIDFAGLSYGTISEEISKLSLRLDPGQTVTVEDIKDYGSKSAFFSIFELTDALGGKDREKALNRLERLLESGESFSTILNAISRHFNHLIMISSMKDLKSDNMVSAKIGKKPYFVHKCREQIAGFSESGLKSVMRHIFQAEYQSRYEGVSKNYILENLVVKITGGQE